MPQKNSTAADGIRRYIKRGDVIIIAALLGLCALLFIMSSFSCREPEHVTVSIDGKTAATLPLSQEGEYAFADSEGREFIIRIENGGVCMLHAECPDLLCVKQGSIFRTGESIVCLPCRVAVTITGGDPLQENTDAVAY